MDYDIDHEAYHRQQRLINARRNQLLRHAGDPENEPEFTHEDVDQMQRDLDNSI